MLFGMNNAMVDGVEMDFGAGKSGVKGGGLEAM